MELLRLLSAALLLLTASGVSNGVLPVCNVDIVIGAGTNIMKWVKPPVASDKYTITSSATAYKPGGLTPITINVTDLDFIYIGILLVAQATVNNITQNVGQWAVLEGDDYFLPSTCKFAAVVHASAELKPMLQTFYWKGDNTTGQVTFRALIKWGEQNHGNFYRPPSLVLSPAPTPVAAQTIWKSAPGASCSETCGAKNMACDSAGILALNSEAALKAKVTDYYACRAPFLKACAPPATGANSECYYTGCATGQSWDTATACSRRSNDPLMNQQFCVCKAGTVVRDPKPPATASNLTLGFRLPSPVQLSAQLVLNNVDITNGVVTVDVSGPQDRWFAIGWNASYMAGTYATVMSLNVPTVKKPQDILRAGFDIGYADSVAGWYDARCQQTLGDYCRIVGGNPKWFSCALAGSNTAGTSAYDPANNMTFSQNLTSRVPCYKGGKVAPYQYMSVSEVRLGENPRNATVLSSTTTVIRSSFEAGQFRIVFSRPVAGVVPFWDSDSKTMPLIWSIGSQQQFGQSYGGTFMKHDIKSDFPVSISLAPAFANCPGHAPTSPSIAPTPPTSPSTGSPTIYTPTPPTIVSGAFSTLPSMLVLSTLGALGSKNWVLGALLAALIRPASAHNWVNVPSRAQVAAVTVPCVTRVNPAPHLQVAPGQEFQLEWSTGHGDTPTIWTYWVFVKEADYLRLAEITDPLLDDYLSNAPAASVISGTKWTKRHLSPWNSYVGGCANCNNGSTISGTFKNIVTPSDPLYIVRNPEAIAQSLKKNDKNVTQFWYNDDMISADKRAAYYNAKYPYIISVHKFRIANHWPDELDIATFTFPNAGYGNYVAHFKWGGYRDCTDVHLINMPTVPNPWGVSQNSTSTFTRIDHCSYTFVLNPATKCTRMVGQNASQCLADCLRSYCTGVQAVLKANPAGTMPYTPNYPTQLYTYNTSLANIFPPPESGPCDSRTIHKRRTCPDVQSMCPHSTIDTWNDTDYLCYGLVPYRDQDFQTTDDYTVTSDPKDPAFYSTCWVKLAPGGFLKYPVAAKPPPVWRTGDKCLSCSWLSDTYANYPLTAAPLWSAGFGTCANCDVVGSPTCKADISFIDSGNVGNCSVAVPNGQYCSSLCDFGFSTFGNPRKCENGVLIGAQQTCSFNGC